MKIIKGINNLIKSWCENLEEGALQQAINISSLLNIFYQIDIMADGHQGYGFPIGSVVASEDSVFPMGAGYDYACGMASLKTNYLVEDISTEQIIKILHSVKREVPVGKKVHHKPQEWIGWNDAPIEIPTIKKELKYTKHSLCTVGSGNHFLELQAGDDGYVYMMLHSGSRHLGWQICHDFHEKALQMCHKRNIELPDPDLAFFPADSEEAKDYFTCIEFAKSFAFENRRRMLEVFRRACEHILKCDFENEINIHHNYINNETHFGKEVFVHRKGATSARLGEKGIIPGDMGSPSYLVEGLGNPESFMSCSHGAGRILSRSKASKTLDINECNEKMKGIVFDGFSKNRKGKYILGESPGAYKNIDEVINAQLDLIKPLIRLRPLGVIKDPR